MRSTVRSVGGKPGKGCFWVKFSMTVALAHTGSERSPSMIGASLGSMRAAIALGRTKPVVRVVSGSDADAEAEGWVAAQPLVSAKTSATGAKTAPQTNDFPPTMPPGWAPQPANNNCLFTG